MCYTHLFQTTEFRGNLKLNCTCFFRDMPISLIRLILFPSSGALSIKCEVRIIITEPLDKTSCYIFIISFILNPYAAGGYIGQYKMMLKT